MTAITPCRPLTAAAARRCAAALLGLAVACTALLAVSRTTKAQTLWVTNFGASGNGRDGYVSSYNSATGAVVNANLVGGFQDAEGIIVAGNVMYEADGGTAPGNARVASNSSSTMRATSPALA